MLGGGIENAGIEDTDQVIIVYLCKITISIHQLEPKEPSDHEDSTSVDQVISVKLTYKVGKLIK